MDISVIKALAAELAGRLSGARVVDVAEGSGGDIFITFKTPNGRETLLVNPRPELPRLYLTQPPRGKPKAQTPFCGSLRNRLTGAAVDAVVQEGLERVITIRLIRRKPTDAPPMGGVEEFSLVFELTGKKPNLILTDGEGVVVAAQSCVSISDETPRPVLPGLRYAPPPAPGKTSPHAVSEKEIDEALKASPDVPPYKTLFNLIAGISPLIAREAASLTGSGADAKALKGALDGLLTMLETGPYGPRIYHTQKGPVLAAFALGQFEGAECDAYGSMSEAAERFYGELTGKRLFDEKKKALLRDAHKRLVAAKRKLAAIDEDIARSGKAELYRRWADLIMAQLPDVPDGASGVVLKDVFSEGEPVEVPLEPARDAVGNAKMYYTRARKAASGAALLVKRREGAFKEAAGLTKLVSQLGRAASIEELPVKQTASPKAGASALPQKALPFRGFVSSDGFEVFYGRNAGENDLLTFKHAQPMDLWLHAQGSPGSHVIVRNPSKRPDMPLATIIEAAQAAAYLSGARKEGSAAVDYTFKKYVRKPRKPVPGQAIITQNKTVFVGPKRPPDGA